MLLKMGVVRMKLSGTSDSGSPSKRAVLLLAVFILFFMMAAFRQTPLCADAQTASEIAESAVPQDSVDISPMEDLMREHGLLDRILLIYQEILSRMEKGSDFPVEVLQQSSGIVRHFVEDYHEKLEEEFIFPRFEKSGKLTDLATVLRQQHDAGRRLTDETIRKATVNGLKNQEERKILMDSIRSFIRLYRPHKSREDTVLFPAFHSLVTPAEYDKMGDMFEDRENALFGDKGFERNVEKIAEMEKKLGIYELKSFTPQL